MKGFDVAGGGGPGALSLTGIDDEVVGGVGLQMLDSYAMVGAASRSGVRVAGLGDLCEIVAIGTVTNGGAPAGIGGPGDHRPIGAGAFNHRTMSNALGFAKARAVAAAGGELLHWAHGFGPRAFALPGLHAIIVGGIGLQVVDGDAMIGVVIGIGADMGVASLGGLCEIIGIDAVMDDGAAADIGGPGDLR